MLVIAVAVPLTVALTLFVLTVTPHFLVSLTPLVFMISLTPLIFVIPSASFKIAAGPIAPTASLMIAPIPITATVFILAIAAMPLTLVLSATPLVVSVTAVPISSPFPFAVTDIMITPSPSFTMSSSPEVLVALPPSRTPSRVGPAPFQWPPLDPLPLVAPAGLT
eukprot:Sspe_Gene.31718::Locus_15616_Transcript_1_1_Confidence_1.000_Length_1415::g.31718::m.31718